MKQVTIVCAVLWLAGSLPASRAADERVLFREDFEATLAAGWRWLAEDGARWRLADGRLEIHTAPGGIHADDKGLRNLLVRLLPKSEESLCVEVEVWNRPASLYENAGLMLYVDDDSYVRVNKESFVGHLDPPVQLQVVSEVAGKFHDDRQRRPYDRESSVVLRMRIDEDVVTAFYRESPDDPWIEFGEILRPRTGPFWVGVETSYGEDGADRWAGFDNFRIVAGC